MLTVFSIPKAFRDEIAGIQGAALASWARLPACELIVFGDEEGVAAAAAAVGARHVPEIARNEHGTPLLSDAFATAARLAVNSVICFANTDVVLLPDLLDAAAAVTAWSPRFLLTGRCTNVEPIDADRLGGNGWLDDAMATGTPRGHDFLDYFVWRVVRFN